MSFTQQRINSLDVFRAITMVLMIFVNDFWTLTGIPSWLEHSGANQDFLGFSDVIFPCFLFIVGMAIPYAIKNRLAKGDSVPKILMHIGLRSFALLIMGVFTVNIDSLNAELSEISRGNFQILMVLGFFLIWNAYPVKKGLGGKLFISLQFAGMLLLLWLFFIFRGGPDGLSGMKTQWWGILGLIGWTYLISSLIYLFAGKSPLLLILFWIFFSFLNIAEHAGWFNNPVPGGGAFQGFAFAGIMASLILDKVTRIDRQKLLPLIFLSAGILLLILGMIMRNYFIISKIKATPTWVFLCNGIAFIVLSVIYYLVDLKGKVKWFNIIKPAGIATLTCYLIPYVYYSLAGYFFSLPDIFKTGGLGLVKSFTFAMVIVGITAVLMRFRIRLKI